MSLQANAERIAGKVDANLVGLDPITIVTILTTVLPLLISCFKKQDEPEPAEVAEAVRDANARNPRKLLRRTTRSVKHESDVRLTTQQAEEIAQAIIDDACSQPDSVVAEACR